MDVLFSNEFLLIMSIGFLMLVIVFVNLITDNDTPAGVVVLVGLGLIVVSACSLYTTDVMNGWAENFHMSGRLSDERYKLFKDSSKVFLFIFPFVSAAVGTNLISDALTKKLHYKKELTISGIIIFFWEFIKTIVGFLIVMPIAIIIETPIFLFGKFVSVYRCILMLVPIVNRYAYLKLLKFDIKLRFMMNRSSEPCPQKTHESS
jgi:hypothetical protein